MGAVAQPFCERIVDRYAIYDQIAVGGMAVVHLGRLLGPAGFSRTVAIKRLHPQFASNPEFVAMFLDEARLAVRVQHPNVVAPLDVLVVEGELLVVMDYVSGETLSALMRGLRPEVGAPPAIVGSILVDALYGLHAAHEAKAENGAPLDIVHRDISPQNIIVGVDGVARVLDFGVAKAAVRSQVTKDGEIKGKISYMAPEQLKAHAIDRRTDVFAAGIVLWEALTGRRLFRGDDLGQTVERVLYGEIPSPSAFGQGVTKALDAVVLRALQRDPAWRFATARDFAVALEGATTIASASEVADWVRTIGGGNLEQKIQRVAAMESHSSSRVKVSGRGPLDTPLGLRAVGTAELSSKRDNRPWLLGAEAAPETAKPLGPEQGQATPGADPSGVTPTPRSWKRAKRLGAGAVILAALTTVAAFTWAGREPSNQVSTAAAPTSSAPALVAAAPAGAPTPTHELPAEPDSSKSVAPSVNKASNASDSSSERPTTPKRSNSSVTAKAPAPASATLKPIRKAAASPSPAANCNPPYVVDAKGIRRIKPECLQ